MGWGSGGGWANQGGGRGNSNAWRDTRVPDEPERPELDGSGGYVRDPNDPTMRWYNGPMIDEELARTRGVPLREVYEDMAAHGFTIKNGQWHSDEPPDSPNAQAMIRKYDSTGKYS